MFVCGRARARSGILSLGSGGSRASASSSTPPASLSSPAVSVLLYCRNMSARPGFYRQELNKTVWEVPERYQNLTPVGSGAYGSVW